MKKVLVFDHCEFCDGEAYVYSGERTDEDGNQSPVYLPCYACKGTGEMEKLVTLRELQRLLDSAIDMEVVDNAELSKQKPITQMQDSRDSAGI